MNTTTSPADLISSYAWAGFSGQPVTGEAAADHLTLALKILDRDGWVSRDTTPSTEPTALDDITSKSTFREMLYGLVSAVRELVSSDGDGITLDYAMLRASSEGSDSDARCAAEHCLQAILRARFGRSVTDWVSYSAWADRQGRTFDDVRELLIEAADLARTHGPTAQLPAPR
ncbi:DUF6197 family protein [Streptomyces noursei]|uniref:DUF6197 family protein n=1 Tax=Streptomyces noursei TaxID=1971 RepID=UPI0005CAB9D7